MADKRMLSKTILESDNFLDMSKASQALYIHLNMSADDEGFVNSVRRIIRATDSSTDSLDELIDNGYIIAFGSGVVVITHWKQHNYIKADRFKPTAYQAEKALLTETPTKIYTLRVNAEQSGTDLETECIQSGSTSDTQISLDQYRRGENPRTEDTVNKRFVPPTLEDVRDYCSEQGYNVNAKLIYSYYSANGWMRGNSHIVDWKAAVDVWVERGYEFAPAKKSTPVPAVNSVPDILDEIF